MSYNTYHIHMAPHVFTNIEAWRLRTQNQNEITLRRSVRCTFNPQPYTGFNTS